MNNISLLLLLLLAVCVLFALRQVRKKGSHCGCSDCHCNCAGCHHASSEK